MTRRPLMRIGQEFTHPGTGERWRVTDVGTRTFAAMNLTRPLTKHNGPPHPSWFDGPPYAIAEYVWDENDQGALVDVEGIEWVEDLTMKTLTASLGGHEQQGEATWPEFMRSGRLWFLDETREKRFVSLAQLLADLAAQDIACLPATVMQRLIRGMAEPERERLIAAASARIALVRRVLDQASPKFRQTSTWIDLNRALSDGGPLICPACGADYAEAEAKNERFNQFRDKHTLDDTTTNDPEREP